MDPVRVNVPNSKPIPLHAWTPSTEVMDMFLARLIQFEGFVRVPTPDPGKPMQLNIGPGIGLNRDSELQTDVLKRHNISWNILLWQKEVPKAEIPARNALIRDLLQAYISSVLLPGLNKLANIHGVSIKDLTNNQQVALLDLTYNMGSSKMAGFKNFWTNLSQGDISGARAELLDSKYARDPMTCKRAMSNAELIHPTRGSM